MKVGGENAMPRLFIEDGEEAVSGGVHALGEHDIAAHHGGVRLLVVLTEPALALLHHLHAQHTWHCCF